VLNKSASISTLPYVLCCAVCVLIGHIVLPYLVLSVPFRLCIYRHHILLTPLSYITNILPIPYSSSHHNLLGLTGPDLQSMDVMTSKELKLLENVLEVEVPKLRRMVGPSMGTMSDPSEKTKFISG
jgi:hypothetical protein